MRNFLAFLEEERVRYCAVGDTRRFPTEVETDVDVVVAQAALAQVPATLLRFCANSGLRLVQCLQHESTAFFFVVSWTADQAPPEFLQLDICSDYYRGGRLFLLADELLSARTRGGREDGRTQEFFVPAPAHAFIYYLLKRIDKRSLDDRHGEYLTVQWRAAPEAACSLTSRFWSPAHTEIIADAARNGVWNAVRAQLHELRAALRKRLPGRYRGVWPELSRRVQRVRHPTGVFVAIVGPDGSGKSTVIEAVRRDLTPAFRRTAYCHLRPRVGSRPGTAEPTTDPHGQPLRGRTYSIAKAAYYLADYAIGYAWSVRPKLVRSTLLMFDRYSYDLAIDPRRYRYQGPRFVARLVGQWSPRPHLVIILEVPGEVLRERKQEVSLDELRRLGRAYRALAVALPNAYIVDGTMPLADVVACVEGIILDYMADRTRRRLLGTIAAEQRSTALRNRS